MTILGMVVNIVFFKSQVSDDAVNPMSYGCSDEHNYIFVVVRAPYNNY